MPSLRAKIVLFLLRNRHLLRLSLRRETARQWRDDLPAVRSRAERLAEKMGRLPEGFATREVDCNAVPGLWILPPDADRQRTVLYFHGGGYVLGSVRAHVGVAAKFAQASRLPVLLFGYRLAPEHPYPAALEDAVAAWTALLQSGQAPSRAAFAGDSAGGGLLLSTLLALKDRGLPLPARAVALSPWTDLACTGRSLVENAARCLSPDKAWEVCRDHYAPARDWKDPLLSPLYGDLTGLPPLLLFAGEDETLRDDSVRFASRARQAGVAVRLTVGQGLCHCYPALAPLFPEATQAMAEIAAFLAEEPDSVFPAEDPVG